MAKTIMTAAKETYVKVVENRKANDEKKEYVKNGINYSVVNPAIVDIISLFGEEFKGEIIDLVIVSLKSGKWTVTAQNCKGSISEKTRCKNSLKEKLKRLNSFNISSKERKVIEEAVSKYCKILASDKKTLILQLNMDIED